MATQSSARRKRKVAKRASGKSAFKKAGKKSAKKVLTKKKSLVGKTKTDKTNKLKKRPPKKTLKKKRAVVKTSASVIKRAPAKSIPKSVLLQLVESALADMKAVNVTVLDVRGLTDVADSMVIASGNSDRHVKSIAENVVVAAKKAGFRPMGVEGERDGEWALVDLQDIIVHVMLPRVREFYRLENLWDISAARREAMLRPG